MIVQCPHCGKMLAVNGLGRKRLDVPAKNIYDRLALGKSIPTIARELECSRGYIYKVLAETKKNG